MEISFYLRSILAVLATYRISRLITVDVGPFRIFLVIRSFCGRMAARRSSLWMTIADGINCSFCVGEWVALILLLLILKPTLIGDLFLLWQAIAGVQTFMQSVGTKEITVEITRDEVDD